MGMPLSRWDVHVSAGLFVVVILALPFIFVMLSNPYPGTMINIAGFFLPALILGSLALIVGSVLPDIDGKGNIRWIIGPVLGGMAMLPPLTSIILSEGAASGLSFLIADGALIVLFMTIAGYSLLLLPLKHRGFFHRPIVGITFGLIWCVYLLTCASLTSGLSILGGTMGSVGYLWHLALDGSLF